MSLNFSETGCGCMESILFSVSSLLNHFGVAVRVDICLLVGEYLLARSLNQGEGGAKLVGDVGEEA